MGLIVGEGDWVGVSVIVGVRLGVGERVVVGLWEGVRVGCGEGVAVLSAVGSGIVEAVGVGRAWVRPALQPLTHTPTRHRSNIVLTMGRVLYPSEVLKDPLGW